jgi:hypothetical protein
MRNKTRRQHLEKNFEIYEDRHDSQLATKRLFSNRGREGATNEAGTETENDAQYGFGDVQHSGKRPRISDWPLVTENESRQGHRRKSPLRNRSAANSPGVGRRASSLTRPSRFIEGSMNDRTSRRPPAVYIGADEETRERGRSEGRMSEKLHKKTNSINRHSYQTDTQQLTLDKTDSNRSSIFRFGKSIAASFNPSNWKIWSKTAELESTAERDLRQRKENAELIYKELKQNGQFRDFRHAPYNHLCQGDDTVSGHDKHDSGVQFGDPKSDIGRTFHELNFGTPTSKHEKRYARFFADGASNMVPPNPETSPQRSETHTCEVPASEVRSSARQSSFQFRKPSITNLGLGSSTKLPLVTGDLAEVGSRGLRRLPSRKDLQKQQKLVKRVSNLEEKLEAARRQLLEAMGEPLPSQSISEARTRFVPGTLATLPSERFLSSHTSVPSPIRTQVESGGIGQALTTNLSTTSDDSYKSDTQTSETNRPIRLGLTEELLSHSRAPPLNPTNPLEDKMADSPPSQGVTGSDAAVETSEPIRRTSKRRKSIGLGEADDGGKYHPDNDDNEEESEISGPVIKRMRGRPRKFQKVDLENAALVTPKNTTPNVLKKVVPLAKTGLITRKGGQSASSPSSPKLIGFSSSTDGTNMEKRALEDNNDDNEMLEPTPCDKVTPVPKLPKSIRLRSQENVATKGREIKALPDPDVLNSRGLPYCTACNQEFSSRNRLVTHVSRFCKVLRDNTAYANSSAGDIQGPKELGARKVERQDDDSDIKGKKSFEWPADVF